MSIISNIRKYLRLDNAVLSLDREFTDAAGLYLTERKELMKPAPTDGCFEGDSSCNPSKHIDTPAGHHAADYHFG